MEQKKNKEIDYNLPALETRKVSNPILKELKAIRSEELKNILLQLKKLRSVTSV